MIALLDGYRSLSIDESETHIECVRGAAVGSRVILHIVLRGSQTHAGVLRNKFLK